MQIYIPDLRYLWEPPYLYYGITAFIFLCVILLTVYYRRTHLPIIPFKSSGGIIEIAPQTLKSVIQNAAMSVEGVDRVACRHFAKRKGVSVKLAIHMRAQSKLQDVEVKLKKRIRAALFEQFGMESVDPIHIKVTKIVGDPLPIIDPDETDNDTEFSLTDDEMDLRKESRDDRPFAEDTRL